MMFNGFLQSQGFPKKTQFNIERPSETISNLINYAVKKHLMIDIDSMPYVKPLVTYVKDVVKLGKNREFLQQMNTTEVSNKLTDTLNLEVNKSCRDNYRLLTNHFAFFLRSLNRYWKFIAPIDMPRQSHSVTVMSCVKLIHMIRMRSRAWVDLNRVCLSLEAMQLRGSSLKKRTRHSGRYLAA